MQWAEQNTDAGATWHPITHFSLRRSFKRHQMSLCYNIVRLVSKYRYVFMFLAICYLFGGGRRVMVGVAVVVGGL